MIVKPIRLSSLRRVCRIAGQHQLVITGLGAFRLDVPGDFLTEAELWQAAAAALNGGVLDAGLAKPQAEALVAGDACAPNGEAVTHLKAGLEIGPIRKEVAVFGERWWQRHPEGPVMTEPRPFKRLPLAWENAFGGLGHAENPLGKGADASALLRRKQPAPLPRIERIGALVLAANDRPAPVCLAPLPEDAAVRCKHLGTYDDDWLKDDFPHFARDFNPLYNNIASEDQRINRPFRGDESFRLTGLHPEHPNLRGHLPGLRIRAFIRQSGDFKEVPLRCDTVWFLPNALTGILLVRGSVPVADKEASEVPHVLFAYEHLTDAPRKLAHYEQEFDERTHQDTAGEKFFDERPIKPEKRPEEVAAAEAERAEYIEERDRRAEAANEHHLKQAFAMAGIPPLPKGLMPGEPPPKVDLPVITPGEISRMEVDMAGFRAKMEAFRGYAERESAALEMRGKREVAKAFRQSTGALDTDVRGLVEQDLKRSAAFVNKAVGSAGGNAVQLPPAKAAQNSTNMALIYNQAKEIVNERRAAAAVSSESGMSAPLHRALNRALGRADPDDPIAKARRNLAQAKAQFKTARGNAAKDMPEDFKARTRIAELTRKLKGEPPLTVNPFQAAMDTLRKADPDYPQVAAPAAKLAATAASPAGAYFTQLAEHLGVKSHSEDGAASLDSAEEKVNSALAEAEQRLDEAETTLKEGTDTGRRQSPEPMVLVDGVDGPLSQADASALGALALKLVRGEVDEALQLPGAELARAPSSPPAVGQPLRGGLAGNALRGRDFAGANLAGADLSNQDLTGTFFEMANLSGANLSGCELAEAVFTKANLTGADLSFANLAQANLCGATATGASFRNARVKAVLVLNARFEQADFSAAEVAEVSALDAVFAGANFTEARLNSVSFLRCELADIILDGARLHTVSLLESTTSGLSARAARLEKCTLVGLEGEGSDFTEAEFIYCATVGGARLANARLCGLKAKGTGWRGADMSGANLTAARLDESDLGDVDLTGACLHRASLKRAVLHKAKGAHANFYGATLLEAQAQDAEFTEARFHHANLRAADLTDAKLHRADFTGANLTQTLMRKPARAR